MHEDILEASRIHFPPYLTPGDKFRLFDELRRFPESVDYYMPFKSEEILQGDGIDGLAYVYRDSGGALQEREIKGIVVSNSCDIAPANESTFSSKLLYAPIAELNGVVQRYSHSGKSDEQIRTFTETIRKQRVTSVFYLPELNSKLPESIAYLDDIRPIDLGEFYGCGFERIFSLSQYGFWIFLIKLSIHFTRMQEGVRRFADE